jgi:hypothetical protein
MARAAVGVAVSNSVTVFHAGAVSDPLNASTTAADLATATADMATLVADGASPTEAHVTAMNTAFSALSADIATGSLAQNSDVVVSISTNITTRSQLHQALLAAEKAFASGVGGLGL